MHICVFAHDHHGTKYPPRRGITKGQSGTWLNANTMFASSTSLTALLAFRWLPSLKLAAPQDEIGQKHRSCGNSPMIFRYSRIILGQCKAINVELKRFTPAAVQRLMRYPSNANSRHNLRMRLNGWLSRYGAIRSKQNIWTRLFAASTASPPVAHETKMPTRPPMPTLPRSTRWSAAWSKTCCAQMEAISRKRLKR